MRGNYSAPTDLIIDYVCGNHQAHKSVLFALSEAAYYVEEGTDVFYGQIAGMERLVLSKVLTYSNLDPSIFSYSNKIGRIKVAFGRIQYESIRSRCWLTETEELPFEYNASDGYMLWEPDMVDTWIWGIYRLSDMVFNDHRVVWSILSSDHAFLREEAYKRWGLI